MGAITAVVVTGEPVRTPELDDALAAEGFEVAHIAEADVRDEVDPGSGPQLLLASASLGVERIGRLRHRLTGPEGWPTTLVFPEEDLDALEECVADGYDYVLPPFRPSLLRGRMSSCSENHRLNSQVERLAATAALREYEREMSIAHRIQAGFLPSRLPDSRGWRFASRFRPAREVAGDFYDGFELVHGSHRGFVVADVCDKGVGAALFMALVRTLLRHTAEHTGGGSPGDGAAGPGDGDDAGFADDRGADGAAASGPGRWGTRSPSRSFGAGPLLTAMDETNRYMARNHLEQGYFATVFFGVLDPADGTLVYVNAGHNPPVLVRADGTRRLLEPTGPAVGLAANSAFALGHVTIGPGDVLFAYTDGVTEARSDGGGRFGVERMLSIVTEHCGSHPDELLDGIDRELAAHVGAAEQSDDITMLVLRRLTHDERDD